MKLKKKVPAVGAASTNLDHRAEAQQSVEHNQNTEPKDALQANVSVFDSLTQTQPTERITLSVGLDRIKTGHYRNRVERLRPAAFEAYQVWKEREGKGEKSNAEKKYDALKRLLPAVTWSGCFRSRRADELLRHSGVLCVDVDHLAEEDLRELFDTLKQDPHVLFLFRSPSYHGLKIGLLIDGEQHGEAWEAAAFYFRDCYGFEIDPACKDVSRLCFVSYDPELFLNSRAQLFSVAVPNEGTQHNALPSSKRKEVEELLSHIPARPDYGEWIRVISAVGDVLPDTEAIELLSGWSPEEKPGEYANKLQHRLKYVRFGTLRFLARRHGWRPPKKRHDSAPPATPVLRPSKPSHGIITKRADEFTPQAIRWLWEGFIPFGHLTICEGDPGIGKSTVLNAEIPARLSNGQALFRDTAKGEPQDVILFNAEDDPANTISPRLIAAGADLSRIHILTGVQEESGKHRSADLSRDIEFLREEIRRTKARLVVIDPLNAYLGSQIDSYKDASVRQILSPLAALAQETGTAIVGIRHWGKGSQGKAIHRGLGSTGYTAAARSVLQFALDPDDPASGRVVIAVAKSNLARFPESVAFRIQQQQIDAPDGGTIHTSRIEWLGSSPHTADDLCAAISGGEERIAYDEATEFILAELEANGGRIPAKTIVKTAQENGIAMPTLRRAKAKLKVRSAKNGRPGESSGEWFWERNSDP